MAKVVITALLAVCALWANSDLDRASRLFRQTDFNGALDILAKAEPKTGPVYELMGRSYFMTGEFKRAGEAFEKALASDPSNSDYALWLGRSYGRRAETANPFSAPGLASKARRGFELAVELNPRNMEAVNDLFEYYLEAPGFLGGGLDKATALTEKINQLDPVEYHYALAKIAEHRKDYSLAEEQLRRAVDLAPRQIGRFIDLAKILYKQGKVQEGEAAFAQAEKIAPNSPKLMFARANTYIHAKRNLDEARVLLNKYLKAPLTADDPPREEAQRLLRQASGS
ncbi:MAG: tetratricopeptide repeat protein [Bryobacteraceae bacterium]